jgi:histidinol dehydrogenase
MITTHIHPPKEQWTNITSRPQLETENLFQTVRAVLDDVRLNGDRAVIKYAEKFDHVKLTELQVTEAETTEACKTIPPGLKQAILTAKTNIEKFHAAQKTRIRKIETTPGVTCWQKPTPIEKVGLYIPGGTAPLFSTVLMLAVPARIAGCREIIICTPTGSNGKIHPAIIYAATIAGADKIFKTGGIQAIGAMAYGTGSIPRVYKIFGPGNQYVTAAKQLVGIKDVAVDMPAGPSEVEVIADHTTNPAFAAADLLSQAEHSADSQSILLSTSETAVKTILEEVERQVQALPRKELALRALANSRAIILENRDDIIEFTNLYAPEHLIIETDDYSAIAPRITNAGSVFLGHYTPESAGDYASGTNHTLPTNGHARAYSGVNLDSFMKKITFQEITRDGIASLGQTIITMADSEQLSAHSNAVKFRIKN